MTRANPQPPWRPESTKWFRQSTGLALGALTALVLLVLAYNWLFAAAAGPEQPIAFSHRVHAGKKHISCVMCHDTVTREARAGMPPLQTCMLCHSHIIVAHSEIARLHEHYYNNVPVEWARVHGLPEFVYFDHSVHIHRSIDCSRCHGDVSAMDRIEQVQSLNMGFCIGCHRDNDATHDCFTCHR